MKKLLTTLSILLIATAGYAETITLTSGKVIEGEIIKTTENSENSYQVFEESKCGF